MDLAVKLIVFLPLLAAFIAGVFGRAIGDRGAQVVTTGALLIAAALSWFVFFKIGFGEAGGTIRIATWISSGTFEVLWALRADTLTAVMLIVVTTVSSMVHLYSVGYMAEDKSVPRFMAYLSLFTFAMLMLVTADNLVQLFFGWEGVGLASYLLIGFWYDRPSANAAAIKAFIVNRVGDFGFALGIFAIFMLTGSVQFDAIFKAAPEIARATFPFLGAEVPALTTVCLLLFVGAMGKSAQLGLHTWLPDAMEGPTPVSALIHAATMVTAGIFMVARCSPLFEYSQTALDVVTLVGAGTAFFAATVGLTQFDIKRVVAYSTCSQLGYMFFALGVSAYPAGMFHLMTHAFFKALLFLGAGAVIHAMHHEQDMRRMGGLKDKIPQTYWLMWIGTLALAGIGIPVIGGHGIGFAGFYSKDIILESAFSAHTTVGMIAFWLGIAAAFMTAFYSSRLMFMTFHGAPRWADAHGHGHDAHGHGHDGHHEPHEAPGVMLVPLYVLALGAVIAGGVAYNIFVGDGLEQFWRGSVLILSEHHALHDAHNAPLWVKVLPLVMAISGIALAYRFYVQKPSLPAQTAAAYPFLYRFSFNKWYFDELYDFLFVKPSMWLGRQLWKKGDVGIIDEVGPNGLARGATRLAGVLGRAQSGYLYHYAFAMLIGVAVLVTWYMLSRGQ
ncbi:MAG: NADH-quinone oxidoreductase subunit L [Alphaproteobacteria bacterium]|nr:NADH-quinone oxidoreductase subunit L [Alphaproteobacteria bacterium]MCW5740138.1 NADH-quinone oxidoreductase subunit L [Alphaproteobacteria bacterium]